MKNLRALAPCSTMHSMLRRLAQHFSLDMGWAIAASDQSLGNALQRAGCSGVPSEPAAYFDDRFLGERQFISVGSVNYTFFKYGPLQTAATPGRPLLIIVGQAATLYQSGAGLLRGLAQTRPVIIFDNRGTGLSTEDHPGNYTLDEYADSTAELIEALDLNAPDVLAWSFGGIIGLTTAVKYPGIFARLILVATSAGGDGYRTSELTEAVLPALVEAARNGQAASAAYIFPNTPEGKVAFCRWLQWVQQHPDDSASTEQYLKQQQPVNDWLEIVPASEFAVPNAFDRNFVYDRLGNITVPTLVVAGAQDLLIAPENSQVLAQCITGAMLLQFEDAGHGVLAQHELVAGPLLSAWLDNVYTDIESA